MRRIVFGLCLLLFATEPALADQAAWVTKQQADQAHAILLGRKEIRNLCEPCGETAFTTEAVKDPAVKRADGDDWSVSNNGKDLDLAYVYVEVRGTWVNLAKLVGAPVQDVSAVLPAEPLPRLSDDLHAELLKRLPEYKAADERLNKAWKDLLPVVPKGEKDSLSAAQKGWIDEGRDLEVLHMLVNHKFHMPVPAATLRDGAVDPLKAYTLLTQSRAERLEELAKSYKGGTVTLAGVWTVDESGQGDPYLLLDDGWTWMFLCNRDEPELEALKSVSPGSRIRVTGRLNYADKFTCDKNMRVETLAPPVKPAEKGGEAKAEQISVIGSLGSVLVPGDVALIVKRNRLEYYTFNAEDVNAAGCRSDELEMGDLVEVAGTLRTPPVGLPYFDPKAPTRCERLVP